MTPKKKSRDWKRAAGLLFTFFIVFGAFQVVLGHGEDSDDDGMPDHWENQYGLNAGQQDGALDPDGDGFSNYEEYVADTDPTNGASYLVLGWQASSQELAFDSVSNRQYRLEYRDHLLTNAWEPLIAGLSGSGLPMTVADTNDVPTRFYRLSVGFPMLFTTPSTLFYGSMAINNGQSQTQKIYLTNEDATNHLFMMTEMLGTGAADYVLSGGPVTPYLLAPQETLEFDLAFMPPTSGVRDAQLKFHFNNHGYHIYVPLTGVGEYRYRVNAGGGSYTDELGRIWQDDAGFYNVGDPYSVTDAIAGTERDGLYQNERWDDTNNASEMVYSFDVDPGWYAVRLHFAEIYEGADAIGSRIFDVAVEDQVVLTNYDIIAQAGFRVAHVEELFTEVQDQALEVEFLHKVNNPKISAIEVLSGSMLLDVEQQLWGHIEMGTTGEVRQVVLRNAGSDPLTISGLSFLINQGAAHDFHVLLDGVWYAGGDLDVSHSVNVELAAGEELTVTIQYEPTEEVENEVLVRFEGDFPPRSLQLYGTGGTGTGHPFLHVVIRADELVVDYDHDGMAAVRLDGTDSHTHEFGHVLERFEWSTNDVVFSTNEIAVQSFGLGRHSATLTIYDDNVPPEELASTFDFSVVSASNVPGVLTRYYEAMPGSGEGNAESLMNHVPVNADYGERRSAVAVVMQDGYVGGSSYTGTVMVTMQMDWNVQTMGWYEFALTGGTTNRLLVDGANYTGSVMLAVGSHHLEARYAVSHLTNLPLTVESSLGGGPWQPLATNALSHDESSMLPIVNAAPREGLDLGGNLIEIEGLGFFPSNLVVVHWGDMNLAGSNLTVHPEHITLLSPASNGLIQVQVETPNGMSRAFEFSYTADGPVPVEFDQTNIANVIAPSQGAWGPDGRLYVGSLIGSITVLSFDDDYQVTNTQVISVLETNSNNNILGVAFNPLDAGGPVRLYVAHSQLYANGGECFTGFSPYSGAISMIEGPDFTNVQTVIRNLPVSNHDHGINGIQFDNQGRLYVAVGGNSNAGVTNCNMGGLPESPLSAAILSADVMDPDFNGDVVYLETAGGATNMDQVYGDVVDVAPWVDVKVHAAGLRNPFDMVFTTAGRLYSMDNGPNAGFGGASMSATNAAPDPEQDDMLNLILEGHYYGHPNRNRGRYDVRQNTYYDNTAASVPGEFTQGLGSFQPSVNGIAEYRATTFAGAMRGELILQKWNEATYRVRLDDAGQKILSGGQLPVTLDGLDVVPGPGGVLLGMDYSDNVIKVAVPNDVAAQSGMTAYDIFPWRAPATSGVEFVVGGQGFGAVTDTVVMVGTYTADVTYVSANRLRGVLPVPTNVTSAFLDVTVQSAGEVSVISNAFRYLPGRGNGLGEWSAATNMPQALGEVAAGVMNGRIYVVGDGYPATFAYDPFSNTWATVAARPYVGSHHAAEVVDGRWYLFGGLGGGEGKVQIYDPELNTWSLGSNMPWQAGSVASGVVSGRVFVAGGIVDTATVTTAAMYDPANDTWALVSPMPTGRNHAASASDGQRVHIFGGRGPGSGDGNTVAEGFDDVLVYDPGNDTWETSFDVGSTIPALPQKRGGTGKAVWWAGEFYVMGGETSWDGTGQVAGDVYNRVDVYDPATRTWRLDTPMLTPRHGIFPVLYDRAIYVPGGGTQAGYAVWSGMDILLR